MNFENFLYKYAYNSDLMNEASFKVDDMEHACDLYGKLMGKSFGAPFNVIGREMFTKTGGQKGVGVRMMNNNGQQLRFDFVKHNSVFNPKSNHKSLTVTGIDYWDSKNTDFEKPTLSVTFNASVNVIQIWRGLAKLIKSKKFGTVSLEDLMSELDESLEVLNEAAPAEIRLQFLQAHGLNKSWKYSRTFFLNKIRELGLEKEWQDFTSVNVTKGKEETNSFSGEIRDMQAKFDDQVYADPKTVFKDIEDLTEFVGRGYSKSLIVCGMGGVGKTYGITSTLKRVLGQSGDKWTYHAGAKTSPRSFYATVYRERDKCIVFDEADSFLKNDDIIMMLKPALDTSGDNMLEYSVMTRQPTEGETWEDVWSDVDSKLSQGAQLIFGNKETDDTVIIPGKFKFDGQMIFISNMRAKEIDDAIKSRSLFIDVYLCATDVTNRCISIAKAKGYSDQEIQEIAEALGQSISSKETNVTYMTPELARKRKQLTVRTLTIGHKLREAGLSRWAELMALYA